MENGSALIFFISHAQRQSASDIFIVTGIVICSIWLNETHHTEKPAFRNLFSPKNFNLDRYQKPKFITTLYDIASFSRDFNRSLHQFYLHDFFFLKIWVMCVTVRRQNKNNSKQRCACERACIYWRIICYETLHRLIKMFLAQTRRIRLIAVCSQALY